MEQSNWSLESLQGYRGLGAHTESEVVYLIYFWGIFWTFWAVLTTFRFQLMAPKV